MGQHLNASNVQIKLFNIIVKHYNTQYGLVLFSLVGVGFCSLKYEMNEFCPFVLSMPFTVANIQCYMLHMHLSSAFSLPPSLFPPPPPHRYQRVTKAHQN